VTDQRLSPVYIILPTDEIGGAEKRLAGLFLHFQKRGRREVSLVLSHALRDRLLEQGDLKGLAPFTDRMQLFKPGDARRHLPPLLSRLHREDPGSVFHYVMISPLLVQRFLSPRTLFTITNAKLYLLSAKGKADILGGAARATRVDVLDHLLYQKMARGFAWKSGAFSVTPNSYVDLEHYQPASWEERTQAVVFTGLFSEEKQVFRLVDQLPSVLAGLERRGIAPPAVRLLGRETRSPGIAEQVARTLKRYDVTAGYDPNPAQVLRTAKAYLALQRASNYPSKALLEAMACGVLPIVTDTGTTRRLAHEDFALFLPREFTAEQLTEHLATILTMPRTTYEQRARAGRRVVEERFTIDSMAAYYAQLYEQLGAL
jgi:glycosyltransferase involved in cell wall biosynthesis